MGHIIPSSWFWGYNGRTGLPNFYTYRDHHFYHKILDSRLCCKLYVLLFLGQLSPYCHVSPLYFLLPFAHL